MRFLLLFFFLPTLLRAGDNSVLDRLAQWMSGSFSSEQQSKEDPEYFHVVLHMVPVWKERTDGKWLYVEQAMASAADKPYRQRVYQLTTDANGTLISRVYTLPGDSLQFAGEWKKENPLATLKKEDLTERSGCEIHLTAKGETGVEGSTQEKNCASDLRGAKYATSKVTISQTELRSWDQGFDSAGQQVWGAKKGPYIFKKGPAAPK